MYRPSKFLLLIVFSLIPLAVHPQDCCGPGGGGGGGQSSTAFEYNSDNYRIKSVRHYNYTARRPGFTAGLETAGFTDKAELNFTPRLEYFTALSVNDKSSFDIYGAGFYSVFADAPYSHQLDLSENIAWKYAITDKSRFTLRVDNENLFVYFPGESGFKYVALDPSAAYTVALSFGDISLSAGVPVTFKPESRVGSWACLGYEHPIGLGISVCPRFMLSPDSSYSGTTLTLTFAWDAFYAKAALIANDDFSALQIRPYAEYGIKNFVFWGGVGVDIPENGKSSVIPFIGAGYNFYKEKQK